MKIVENNFNGEDLKCKCPHCKSLLEFNRSECRRVSKNQIGSIIAEVIQCPCCKKEFDVYVNSQLMPECFVI